MQGSNISNGRHSLVGAASNEAKEGTAQSQQLEEMLRQTTRDNMQLKQQLQQMIDINSQQ